MRYVVRPRATKWDDLQETPLLKGDEVHEPEPVDTGILDKDGNTIWRVMSPVGFIELKERN